MGDQPLARTDLDGIIVNFTMTLTALTELMATLITQVKNTNYNTNQRRDMRKEPIRVPWGGNNHVVIGENSSSEEEESDEEEILDHGNRHNHNYRVKMGIPLFYKTMRVKEFMD